MHGGAMTLVCELRVMTSIQSSPYSAGAQDATQGSLAGSSQKQMPGGLPLRTAWDTPTQGKQA